MEELSHSTQKGSVAILGQTGKEFTASPRVWVWREKEGTVDNDKKIPE